MKDTVNEMLNEVSKKRDRIKMIHVDDIRPNSKNTDFPMCDIEAMALSLRVCGQIDPCVVIPDGAYYKLVSGENTRVGYIVHDKNFIILLDFRSMDLPLEKISTSAIYLNYEPAE